MTYFRPPDPDEPHLRGEAEEDFFFVPGRYAWAVLTELDQSGDGFVLLDDVEAVLADLDTLPDVQDGRAFRLTIAPDEHGGSVAAFREGEDAPQFVRGLTAPLGEYVRLLTLVAEREADGWRVRLAGVPVPLWGDFTMYKCNLVRHFTLH